MSRLGIDVPNPGNRRPNGVPHSCRTVPQYRRQSHFPWRTRQDNIDECQSDLSRWTRVSSSSFRPTETWEPPNWCCGDKSLPLVGKDILGLRSGMPSEYQSRPHSSDLGDRPTTDCESVGMVHSRHRETVVNYFNFSRSHARRNTSSCKAPDRIPGLSSVFKTDRPLIHWGTGRSISSCFNASSTSLLETQRFVPAILRFDLAA